MNSVMSRLIKNIGWQGSRIPISRHLWKVNFDDGKVDFQTLVVRGQVDFNYWIEEFVKNYFKTFSFA